MTEPEIWAALTDVFRDFFGDEGIRLAPDTTARDIEGWDSIAHVQLMVLIEQRFGVRFNTGEVASFKSVGPMFDALSARLNAIR